MTRHRARAGSLERDLADLLGALCTEWGFCLPPADNARIAAARRLSADEFARQVLEAEGFDPEREHDWLRKLRTRFAERFGDAVSERDYRAGAAAEKGTMTRA